MDRHARCFSSPQNNRVPCAKRSKELSPRRVERPTLRLLESRPAEDRTPVLLFRARAARRPHRQGRPRPLCGDARAERAAPRGGAMKAYETIRFSTDGPVAQLELHRPEPINAPGKS